MSHARCKDAFQTLWSKLRGTEDPLAALDEVVRQRFDREYDALLAKMAQPPSDPRRCA